MIKYLQLNKSNIGNYILISYSGENFEDFQFYLWKCDKSIVFELIPLLNFETCDKYFQNGEKLLSLAIKGSPEFTIGKYNNMQLGRIKQIDKNVLTSYKSDGVILLHNFNIYM
jgi:hypothetical protein